MQQAGRSRLGKLYRIDRLLMIPSDKIKCLTSGSALPVHSRRSARRKYLQEVSQYLHPREYALLGYKRTWVLEAKATPYFYY